MYVRSGKRVNASDGQPASKLLEAATTAN